MMRVCRNARGRARHMTRAKRVMIVAGLASAALAALTPARAEAVGWPDDFLSRLEALALVQTLNAEILASRSATLTLEKWCGEHRLARGRQAKIGAPFVRGEAKAA